MPTDFEIQRDKLIDRFNDLPTLSVAYLADVQGTTITKSEQKAQEVVLAMNTVTADFLKNLFDRAETDEQKTSLIAAMKQFLVDFAQKVEAVTDSADCPAGWVKCDDGSCALPGQC